MSEHNIVIYSVPGNLRYPYYVRCSCAFGAHAHDYAEADYYKRSHQHAHHLPIDVPQVLDPALSPYGKLEVRGSKEVGGEIIDNIQEVGSPDAPEEKATQTDEQENQNDIERRPDEQEQPPLDSSSTDGDRVLPDNGAN